MTIFSLIMLPLGYSNEKVLLILMASMLSFIPDIDVQLELRHRTYTHNILAGILVGLGIGTLFYSIRTDYFFLGFLSGFGGVMSHIMGDIIAGQKPDGSPWKLKVLWPFSNREIGLGIVKSSNKEVNRGLLYMGIIAFVLYILITQGLL